jgi:peptidoglycan/xylan/chitin deacetylase (PgdA/CDA1 family)
MPVPILMYHSINERPPATTAGLAVGPAAFADQMDLLKDRGFTPLTLTEMIAVSRALAHGAKRKIAAEKPVVITFDDGYADFHERALPILERHGFPATVFLTTGWMRDAGQNAAGLPLDRTLSWLQVEEAAAAGIEFGGHSHSHPQLDQLPDRTLRDELVRNKKLVEDRLGTPVRAMAYPFGYSSARVRREVGRAGYASACAVANDLAADRHDVLALPRLTVRATMSLGAFERAISGQGVPMLYLRDRILTKGYTVVRRGRYATRRMIRHV